MTSQGRQVLECTSKFTKFKKEWLANAYLKIKQEVYIKMVCKHMTASIKRGYCNVNKMLCR